MNDTSLNNHLDPHQISNKIARSITAQKYRFLAYPFLTFILLFCSLSETRAAIPAAAQADPRFEKGFLVVTHYDGVDSSGVLDSHAGIQAAIKDAYENRLTLYFPYGTYTVSDTLECYEYQLWDTSRGRAANPNEKRHILLGQSGELRPVIQLATDASGFGDPSDPRPVICFRNFAALNDSGTSPVSPINPLNNPANFEDMQANLFDERLQGIDIDTNTNRGGIGVVFPSAQNAAMIDVTVYATGSFCAFYGLPGRNSITGNITAIGGDYGALITRSGLSIRSLAGAAGVNVAGARFVDQEIATFLLNDFVPTAIVGFHIEKNTDGPVTILGSSSNFNNAGGSLCLIDGTIELSGETAGDLVFDNSDGRNLYLKNVYISGTDALIQSGSATTISATGTWKRIVEYNYNDSYERDSNPDPLVYPDYPAGTTYIESRNAIDGVVSQTLEAVVEIESDLLASDIPGDLLMRHLWASLPAYDDGESFLDATEAPYGAVPNDAASDSVALQAAIDDASAAGHGRVFLPKGLFLISEPLILRANTVFFGAGSGVSTIEVHNSWVPTPAEVNPYMIETVDDIDGTTFLGFINIESPAINQSQEEVPNPDDRFGFLKWQVGRNSMSIGFDTESGWAPYFYESTPKTTILFTGNAGGRHYGVSPHLWTDSHPDVRLVKIDGTSEPLSFYGLNIEITKNTGGTASHADTNLEIVDSANIRIYGIKREGNSPTALIHNSSNIAIYANGAMRDTPFDGGDSYFDISGVSDNILIAGVATQLNQRTVNASDGKYTLRDTVDATVLAIPYPNFVSIYKRGVTDDSLMYTPTSGSAAPYVPTGLAAVGTSISTIEVTWNDVSDEIGYRLKRSDTSGGNFTQIGADLSANMTSYTDSGLDPDSTHYYRVSAFNSNGSSASSPYTVGSTFPIGGDNGGTVVETESATLGGGASTGSYFGEEASGGSYVTLDTLGEYMEWIVNPGSGTRTVTIRYACNDTKNIDISLNGSVIESSFPLTGTGRGNGKWLLAQFTTDFNVGDNTLRFTYSGGVAAVDIDFIEFETNIDNTSPTIEIDTPLSGDTVSGDSVLIEASASDNIGVFGVQFEIDGAPIGAEVTAAPYSIVWDSTTVPDGLHLLTATARDETGNATTSATVALTVDNGNSGNTLSLEGEDATLGGGANTESYFGEEASGGRYATLDNLGEYLEWTFDADAGLNNVSIRYACSGTKNIEIKLNDVVLASSFGLTGIGRGNGKWKTVEFSGDLISGSNTLRFSYAGPGFAVDIDIIEISLPTDTVSPSVSLDSPIDGDTVSGSAVNINANASDNVGVAGVQFQLDGVDLGGEDTSAPYSLSWDTTAVADGTYELTAIARDAAGNITTSTGVAVTVENTSNSEFFEAEDATSGGGASTGSYFGAEASGGRYATLDAFGEYIEWDIESEAGPRIVKIRFAGSGTKNIDILLNGTVIESTFPLTGTGRGDGHWIETEFSTYFNSGINTLSFAYAGPSFAVDIDRIEIVTPPDLVVEAEAAILGGGASTGSYFGAEASGGSYTTLDNLGEYMESVIESVGGLRTVKIRFACTDTKNIDIMLNGVLIEPAFPLTGTGRGDGKWLETEFTALFATGTNTLRFTYAGPGFAVDIDKITVAIASDTESPTVSIDSPVDGQAVWGAAVDISANAEDAVGVASVQFLLDGAPLGSAVTGPSYSVTLDSTSLPDGSYELTAVATDIAGNSSGSTPVTIEVFNRDSLIEGETASLSEGAATDSYFGINASKGRYANLDTEGESLLWYVSPGVGSHTVKIRFACSDTKKLRILINRLVVEPAFSLVGTGRGNWLEAEFEADFLDGANRLQLFYTDSTGGLDIDYIEFDVAGDITLPAPAPGDFDGNGVIDVEDRLIIVHAFHTMEGDEGFIAEADLNGDKTINHLDFREWLVLFLQQK